MKYYSTTFFCDAGKGPKISIISSKEANDSWPIVLSINASGEGFDKPDVLFHLATREDAMAFFNSALCAYYQISKEAK